MVDVLIKNGIIVTMAEDREIIKRGAVAIEGTRIVGVGPTDLVGKEYSADTEIDASRHIVLPGLINTHTHLAMTLFRGIMDGVSGMEWLERAWSIESSLTAEDVYWGSLLGCLEMIKSGTTCFADHYFFMERAAAAVETSGLRAALAQAIIEEKGPEGIDTTLEGSIGFAQRYHGAAGGRITCMLGPHSAYTCSPELLREVREAASEGGLRVHIHLSESRSELRIVRQRYQTTPTKLLSQVGLLGPDLLAAHVVFAGDEELGLLKESNTKVNHNPVCKMKGGHGVSPVAAMLRLGINVSLGTDGPGSNNSLDMLEEMKFAAVLHPVVEQNPAAISAWDVLEMSTIRGARAIGIDGEVGSIEPGKRADIILVRANAPHMTPLHNIPSLVVYSANGNDVDGAIVDGRLVMTDRKVLTLDEGDVMAKAQAAFEDLLERSGWEHILDGIPRKAGAR